MLHTCSVCICSSGNVVGRLLLATDRLPHAGISDYWTSMAVLIHRISYEIEQVTQVHEQAVQIDEQTVQVDEHVVQVDEQAVQIDEQAVQEDEQAVPGR